MRIVFIGTVDFSLRTLQKVIDLGADVAGVVTKEKSNYNADFANLAPVCAQHGIPCLFVKDINAPENVQWMRDRRPDIIFCFGISSLLKTSILQLAPMGVVGYHPALLPQNRGRHPLIWALNLGLAQTGSTFFFMDEGADSGDILSQRVVAISEEDNAATLYEKMVASALEQIGEFYPQLVSGSYPRIPQDGAKANYWRKRSVKDGLIDFRMTGRDICNLVRALVKPYVGAHLIFEEKEVKVWEAEMQPHDGRNIEYGKILAADDRGVLVKCSDGAVLLKSHSFEALPKEGDYL